MQDAWIDRVAEVRRAEVDIRRHAAEVAARRGVVLYGRVPEVAVWYPVLVAVGPGARGVGRDTRRRIGQAVVRGRDRRLEIFAERALDRGLAVAEQIVGNRGARREVVVSVDDRGPTEDERRREEPALEALIG